MSKKETKLDPRVVRTRQLLRAALISLIPGKGFDAITVQDITDAATLNRATFYLHYRDKNELLMDVFRDLTTNAVALPQSGTGDPTAAPDPPSIAAIFDHIAEHADFYRAMLGEEGVPAFAARMRGYVEEIGLKWFSVLQPDAEHMSVRPEIAINFLGSAYLGVIAWWLDNDMPYPSEFMADQLMRLTALGLHRSLGVAIPPGVEA